MMAARIASRASSAPRAALSFCLAASSRARPSAERTQSAAPRLQSTSASAADTGRQLRRQQSAATLNRSNLIRGSAAAVAGSAALRTHVAMAASTSATQQQQQAADTGAVVVYVTVPSMEVGEKIASALVESKLAACVQIVPGLTSVYFWEGKVNKDPELLLIIKTRGALVEQLTSAVKSMHPYTEPEVVATPITGGSPSYLKWLVDSTKAAA